MSASLPLRPPRWQRLRELAAGFFSLAPEDKTAIGDFRFVGDTYAGYRDSASIDAEFLEVHTTDTNGTYPPLAKPAGLSKAAAALHARLDAMSRRMLVVLASHINVPAEALLAPLDPPRLSVAEPAPNGEGNGNGGDDNADLSSSCLRVCHYRRRPEDNAPSIKPDDDDPQIEVLFDSHTDSSLLTLSTLCPGAPGLQLQVGGEWLSIESVDGVSEVDVEVHVGDFLCFLSRDYFPSCVHRVVRPLSGPGRLSFPLPRPPAIGPRAGHNQVRSARYQSAPR